jgi:hypothetical protein
MTPDSTVNLKVPTLSWVLKLISERLDPRIQLTVPSQVFSIPERDFFFCGLEGQPALCSNTLNDQLIVSEEVDPKCVWQKARHTTFDDHVSFFFPYTNQLTIDEAINIHLWVFFGVRGKSCGSAVGIEIRKMLLSHLTKNRARRVNHPGLIVTMQGVHMQSHELCCRRLAGPNWTSENNLFEHDNSLLRMNEQN